MAQDHRALSAEEDWLQRKLKQHCLTLASLERTIARLRSRVRHLKEGDGNTAFFHKQASFIKKKNFIAKLVVDDQVFTAQQDKHNVLYEYFDGILGTAVPRASSLDLLAFHHAGLDLSVLDKPFTDEVWATIRSLPADRAPGPDGYTGQFYKTCWPIIKTDFTAAILTLQ